MTRPAWPAGTALVVAVALTATAAWTAVFALLDEAIGASVRDEFERAGGPRFGETFTQRPWALLALLAVAVAALVAWLVFVLFRRGVEASRLLPYAVTTAIVMAIGGFFTANAWLALVNHRVFA